METVNADVAEEYISTQTYKTTNIHEIIKIKPCIVLVPC